jgi:hypothetical protein
MTIKVPALQRGMDGNVGEEGYEETSECQLEKKIQGRDICHVGGMACFRLPTLGLLCQ